RVGCRRAVPRRAVGRRGIARPAVARGVRRAVRPGAVRAPSRRRLLQAGEASPHAGRAGDIEEEEEAMALAERFAQGKVRDIYEAGDDLLLVATDRISAFDVVLPTPIPDKGRVLTGRSLYWFERTRNIVANHLLSADASSFPDPYRAEAAEL